VFQPLNSKGNEYVDVMVVGTSDGGVHLSIYDTFAIGMFNITLRQPSLAKEIREPVQLCCHASSAALSTHSLLFSSKGDRMSLYLVPMDITFIDSSPVNLSLLASKTTTLQKLLRYVKQAQSHMTSEFQSTRELPSRFLAGIQDDLQGMQGGPRTIVEALFHTVATGHTYPVLKEWLVDTLAERVGLAPNPRHT